MKFGFTRREIKPPAKEEEEEFSKGLKENKVGFKEGLAIVLSAFLTIVLPSLLVLAVLSLLTLLVFGAFRC